MIVHSHSSPILQKAGSAVGMFSYQARQYDKATVAYDRALTSKP